MKVGGMIFTLGMFIMCVGVGFEDLAISFTISWFGLFMMWVSVAVMISEKSEWLEEDIFDK
tara:strand:+ start:47 stop:229 length:183 start_codon:yes stop_codon:yes gene_type:complete